MTAPRPAPAETRAVVAVLALAMAPAISLGVGRFAYALVLPAMKADLGWSWAAAGWLNAANAAGYMAGALGTTAAMRRLGMARTLWLGVVLALAGMAGCAVTGDVIVLAALRGLTGLGGALAFVAGGVAAAGMAQRAGGGFLLGLYYAGPGLGIFVSGAAVPVWLGAGGGWPGAWVMLAGLSAVLALPLLAVRAAGGGTADGGGGPVPLARMAPLMLGYAGFGVGYIGYMTFVFAWVRERWGEGSGQAGFWMVLGLGVMAAPWLWARLMDRLPAARAFGVLTALCGVAAALPLAGAGDGWLWASAALFGASFFAVVATTTQFVRQNMAPEAWPRGVAAVTIAFSLGQTAGPVLSGWAGDALGGLSAALGFSAAVLLAGAAVGAMQPRLR